MNPHPNIVKYHGARVNSDGYVTGLVFDSLPHTLCSHVEAGNKGTILADKVLADITPGLAHIRSLGLIYTDTKPENIMWHAESSSWCLIDLADCHPPGQYDHCGFGTLGWTDHTVTTLSSELTEGSIRLLTTYMETGQRPPHPKLHPKWIECCARFLNWWYELFGP